MEYSRHVKTIAKEICKEIKVQDVKKTKTEKTEE